MPPRSDSRDAKSSGRARKVPACFSNTAWRVSVSLESSAERHGIAFNAGPFAEIVVGYQNLPVAIGEGGDRLGVTPAEGGAPDIPCDASQGVIVCRRTDILALGFAMGSVSVLPDTLPVLLPHTIGHVVECCLLGLRARPAFG